MHTFLCMVPDFQRLKNSVYKGEVQKENKILLALHSGANVTYRCAWSSQLELKSQELINKRV